MARARNHGTNEASENLGGGGRLGVEMGEYLLMMVINEVGSINNGPTIGIGGRLWSSWT